MSALHEVRNPYDGTVAATVGLLGAEEVDSAIARGLTAFEVYRHTPAFTRAELLRALAAAVLGRSDEIAESIMREAGKPISAARVEVQRGIATLTGAAEEATRLVGDALPLDTAAGGAGRLGIVRRFPIGPVAAISPFNFPLNLGLHKVAPALAVGNSVIWKPPLQAPGAARILHELFRPLADTLGIPSDTLQIAPCVNTVAEALVVDPRIAMLSFTGSSRVGWRLRRIAGNKRVVLELGGNAAAIVAADSDLAYAARRCSEAGFGYAGQVCIAVQRIIVDESVADEFTRLLLEATANIKRGDPADPGTVMGPMISAKEADRVDAWLRAAIDSGAKLLAGGRRTGLMFAPAVVTNVRPNMAIVAEEVFGPVVTIEKYSNWAEALSMANASKFGLQVGIFTRDMQRILQAFECIDVGAVIADDAPTFRVDSMPYGGVKQSGFGREGVHYAAREMTEERLLVLPPTDAR